MKGVAAVEGSAEGPESENHLVAVRSDGNLGSSKHDPCGIFGFPDLPGLALAGVDIEPGDFDFARLNSPREDVIRVRAPTNKTFVRLKTVDRSSCIVLDGESVPSAISQNKNGVPVQCEDDLLELYMFRR